MKVYLRTLGCDKNLVDSEIILGQLDKSLFNITDNLTEADVAIINTCGFIMDAKIESIDNILAIADYKEQGTLKSLLVVGCLSQRYSQALLDEIVEIDGILGTNEYLQINEFILTSLAGKKPVIRNENLFEYLEPLERFQLTPKHYRYIKIAEGCDNHCTFCVIPLIRGSYRSRSINTILTEAQQAVADGAKELILVAQDSTYYGIDLYNRPMLATLVNELTAIPELHWLRILYLYPGGIDDELINTFATNEKLVKYIDMPLQHSEEHLLKKMARPSFQTNIKELIAKLREKIPHVSIRTSLIVGFPGETTTDFNNLSVFVKDVKFDRLGVFTYSDEEESASYKLKEKVPESEKERRAASIMSLQNRIAANKSSEFVGTIQEVLIERYDAENNVYIGRTQYDAPEVDGEVYINNVTAKIGDFISVKITHSYDYDLVAEGIPNEFTE